MKPLFVKKGTYDIEIKVHKLYRAQKNTDDGGGAVANVRTVTENDLYRFSAPLMRFDGLVTGGGYTRTVRFEMAVDGMLDIRAEPEPFVVFEWTAVLTRVEDVPERTVAWDERCQWTPPVDPILTAARAVSEAKKARDKAYAGLRSAREAVEAAVRAANEADDVYQKAQVTLTKLARGEH